MKKIIQVLFVLMLFSASVFAQVIRPFSARYYNPSIRGNIVYVSNSIISTSGVGSGSPGTGEIPPAGTSRNNSGQGINIDVDDLPPTTKIAFGSVWNYHAQNAAPANNPAPTDWKQPAYVMPATWNVGALPVNGPGKYGYNSGQATCLPNGQIPLCLPIGGNKYTAYYFRRTVNFTAAELATTFYAIQLNLLRNDGIVVYVNGVERVRNTMPAGAVGYGTLASANIAPGAAEALSVNLSPSFFNAGVNTIAVEVHLRAASSNDMSFDMQMLGLDNNGTFNSSSADLSLISCSNVLFAGLYWGADLGSSGTDSTWVTAAFNTVKLKIPGSAVYQTITSTATDRHSNNYSAGVGHVGYLCFADITSLVNLSNPNGAYTIADVIGPIGLTNTCGGWTIVIAYANPSLLPRNLTVFDGSVIINGGDPGVNININGFLTPPSGPVSCELGAVVYDGDRSSIDSFSFKQNGAPSFYSLATTTVPFNGTNDAWNSKITYKNTNVTTRNPAYNNTVGYDASIFDLPNTSNAQLSNSQTSGIVRFSSPSENYFVHVLSTSISQYNPTFAFDKTATDLNGGSFLPGDSLRYQVNYNNVGNDSSTNTIITDRIPAATSYIPGSLRINGVSKTDAAGDDQAEFDLVNNRVVFRVGVGANATTGGNIGTGGAGNVQFDVISATSCAILACNASLRNNARITYSGKLSGSTLFDSSGVNTAGCITQGAVINTLIGPCSTPGDTILVNNCPALTVMIPWRKYAGYTIYSAMPFIPANIYDPLIPVSISRIYWAYANYGAGCADTARIAVFIIACPDIDDDNDGIPDYVELNNPVALQLTAGVPNWYYPSYPGFVDNNADGVNDNFDPSADSDNDGIPNFYDADFPGYVDSNADGINDNMDKDLDGIPNHLDLDSDNDGIPDTVESYGVDTNGDGLIDNYVDTDNDGFSQNVDGNASGVTGSGNGLGAPDFDGDGIPNYLDLDSDNDGIPDLIESGGTDANNDGKVDGFADANSDGLTDNYTLASALLITGLDIAPVDGRADNYPNKNKDRDFRPNAYDLDSDGDGIADVIEAGLPDVDLNGRVDGAIGSNGWATVVSSLPSLGLRFTDADPYPDYLDIDSDEDGIPDNIEGQSTAGYRLPVLTDTDGDGIVNIYDNVVGFGGSGIYVYDHDGDGTPDYRDTDTDADGLADIVEGNDFNLNGLPDDDVTLTGLDTDGDGLDNRFDSLNSVTNIKGTSYRMGNLGSFSGDAAPGSRTTVQRTNVYQTDRDWRYSSYVLPVEFLRFTGSQYNNNVLLHWTVIADKEVDRFEIERSFNNSSFVKTVTVTQPVLLQIEQNFSANDDIANIYSDVITYRLKVIGKDGSVKYSNTLIIRNTQSKMQITVLPNPATTNVMVKFYSEVVTEANLRLIDKEGRIMKTQKNKVQKGINKIDMSGINTFSSGVYTLQIFLGETVLAQNLVIWN